MDIAWVCGGGNFIITRFIYISECLPKIISLLLFITVFTQYLRNFRKFTKFTFFDKLFSLLVILKALKNHGPVTTDSFTGDLRHRLPYNGRILLSPWCLK